MKFLVLCKDEFCFEGRAVLETDDERKAYSLATTHSVRMNHEVRIDHED